MAVAISSIANKVGELSTLLDTQFCIAVNANSTFGILHTAPSTALAKQSACRFTMPPPPLPVALCARSVRGCGDLNVLTLGAAAGNADKLVGKLVVAITQTHTAS
jgi:hypothetical protein